MASAAGSRTSDQRPKPWSGWARPLSASADVLQAYWRLHPVEATHAGVRDYDARAPDLTPDGLAARAAWADGLDVTGLDRHVLDTELTLQRTRAEPSPAFYLEQAM